MKKDYIKLAKEHFLKTFKKADRKVILYEYLPKHVAECDRWARRVLKKYPEANKKVLLVSVWLHDIGQAFRPKEKDHAVKSEKEAKRFLSEVGFASELTKEVVHCVRAHRNKDVKPKTLEAKMLAAVDSASHMTDICYIEMISNVGKKEVLTKIERDYRDAGFLRELKREITPLHKAWVKLINVFPD